ncbi:MAG: shikimate dehydrogenase [Actinobacteria bacterium]|nr:shikimate dehydrogenase [Actinomycetota bacterium]
MSITAGTRIAGVIGSPVTHSLSPALHNAAFGQLGLDWVYLAFDVAAGRTGAALEAMRVLGLAGLSVTMPHKESMVRLVDGLDPTAAKLRSVNTVVRDGDGLLVGHSTDGDGFLASLAAARVVVAGKAVCVLGAGGAARAICEAVARAGAARVAVVNRSAPAAELAAAIAIAAGSPFGVVGTAADIADADVVINATSVGMGSAELPCDAALLHADQVVVDIVYQPRVTELLRVAKAAGAAVVDGLGMLVHQAALQQLLWHGAQPDTAVMAAAAERELAARRQP